MSSEAAGHSSPLGPKEPRLVSALVAFDERLAPVLWTLLMRTVSVVGAAILSVVILNIKIGYMFLGFVQLKLTHISEQILHSSINSYYYTRLQMALSVN